MDIPKMVDQSAARAALSSFRFPIRFIGTNRFSRNRGGGVSVVDSMITVAEDSHLIFENNVANFGGGLQLVGLVLVSPCTYTSEENLFLIHLSKHIHAHTYGHTHNHE